MSGITFRVEIDDADARAQLSAMVERMARPIGFYKNVGEYLTEIAIPRNFAAESAPEGTPWARLSPVTIARREAKGQVPITILQSHSGSAQNLKGSIIYQVTDDGVAVGSALPYAGVMQFGAAQGAFGTTSRGGPIPWGNIPARPYLGLSAADEAEIIAIAFNWLAME